MTPQAKIPENARQPKIGGETTLLRITIEPTTSGLKWIARLGDRVLCVAASPLVVSARVLLAEGNPADAVIEMWRPNTNEWALRGRLGAVAATLMDGETASRRAKNGLPARDPGREVNEPTALSLSSSARFWSER